MVENDFIYRQRYLHDYEFSSWVVDNENEEAPVRIREYESQEVCLEDLFCELRSQKMYD